MSKDRRTYAQRADYLKAAVIKRRKRVREQAIAYKGGKCQLCGYEMLVRSRVPSSRSDAKRLQCFCGRID